MVNLTTTEYNRLINKYVNNKLTETETQKLLDFFVSQFNQLLTETKFNK